MKGLSLVEAGYRYPSATAPAVQGVSLQVAPGEVVLLTGPTGCGKSTLLRLACGLLQRHGQGGVLGRVGLDGQDPATLAPRVRVGRVGFVGQEPADQLVAGTVADELAFAMESAGQSGAEIDAALGPLLASVGLDLAFDRDPRTLSGGQTQRLVVAAALSAGAGVLVADEPIAQLDPRGATDLLAGLRTLARDRQLAVLLVEHRLEACWPFLDRVVVMDAGRLVADEARRDIVPGHPLLGTLRGLGLTVPGVLDLADRWGLAEAEVAGRLRTAPGRGEVTGEKAVAAEAAAAGRGEEAAAADRPVRVRAEGLRFSYGDDVVLGGIDLCLRAGERVALLGGNGAGKSTLLGLIEGRLRGRLSVHGRVVGVPQDPDLALFQPSVRDELAHGPLEAGHADVAGTVAWAAGALSLDPLLDRPPHALSRGQRLRVAVAGALSCRPDLLLLDEPTSGQDHDQVERMMRALTAALVEGLLLFATHDVDLALRHATRVLVLHRGRLVADGPPRTVLASLPASLPIVVPPLAALCLDAGRAPATAAELAAAVSRGPRPAGGPP
ncbi:MAG: ATP-binding cassette domain-containing protein [Alphaproteobacteria bacterium]|nr:ATP-binding cassette domain-containing protein [Alphaproteobacteria bacterium]